MLVSNISTQRCSRVKLVKKGAWFKFWEPKPNRKKARENAEEVLKHQTHIENENLYLYVSLELRWEPIIKGQVQNHLIHCLTLLPERQQTTTVKALVLPLSSIFIIFGRCLSTLLWVVVVKRHHHSVATNNLG